MNIREVDPHRPRDVREFVELPYRLYRTCPQWSPPLVSGTRRALDRRRHPFYRHSDAAFFLAEQGGETVGRVAVLENRRYNAHRNSHTAFFYYYDQVDDQEVCRSLFEAVKAWMRPRGLNLLMGPKGMLRADAYGVLVEGYEHTAALAMPYNYPYYAVLLEALGFVKEVDYLSGYLTRSQGIPERLLRVAQKVKERGGFEVRSFRTKRELKAWIPQIQQVNNEAFTEVWGYYPIDDAETQMISKQLLTISNPRMLKLVLKEGKVAGFAFVFPDITGALQATRGRMWPFGWVRLLSAMKHTKILLANGVGLLPQYQGLGGTALLYTELAATLLATDAQHCDLAQVMETNFKSLGDMNALGANWHKRHRVYRLDVA